MSLSMSIVYLYSAESYSVSTLPVLLAYMEDGLDVLNEKMIMTGSNVV